MNDNGIWFVIALGVVAALSALLMTGEQEPQLAPDFTLISLDGETVELSEYRGQVVVVDFWASWCKPCTRTLPAVHELLAQYEDGVQLFLISLDKSEKASRTALEAAGYATSNVLWGSLAEARAVKDLYGVIGIPRTFLIDREGYIQFSGYPTSLTAEKIEALL